MKRRILLGPQIEGVLEHYLSVGNFFVLKKDYAPENILPIRPISDFPEITDHIVRLEKLLATFGEGWVLVDVTCILKGDLVVPVTKEIGDVFEGNAFPGGRFVDFCGKLSAVGAAHAACSMDPANAHLRAQLEKAKAPFEERNKISGADATIRTLAGPLVSNFHFEVGGGTAVDMPMPPKSQLASIKTVATKPAVTTYKISRVENVLLAHLTNGQIVILEVPDNLNADTDPSELVANDEGVLETVKIRRFAEAPKLIKGSEVGVCADPNQRLMAI